MQLMTGLMIFNITSLEVSPPSSPTRHFTQGCLGIITIISHHLTPLSLLCSIICQHSLDDSVSVSVTLFIKIPEKGRVLVSTRLEVGSHLN